MIYSSIYETIGGTPVVKIKPEYENQAEIYAKLEYFNPGGSVKDRISRHIIFDLLDSGRISMSTTLVESTSGNTGIGIAMICAAIGMKFIVTMPETMSVERQRLLKAYGAKIILTDGLKGMTGAIEKAHEIAKLDNHFYVSQFDNIANPETHKMSTALEIIRDFEKLDAFVSGIGTGGTITGCSEMLKLHYEDSIEIIGVEPYGSPFLTQGRKGAHKLQGMGAGFKPEILNLEYIDQIVTVTDDEAFTYARKVGARDGILLGISGGAAYTAALKKAVELGRGKKVLFIAPDNGERYLSTNLYQE